MNPWVSRVLVAVLVIAGVGGAIFWWRQRPAPARRPPPVARAVAPVVAPAPPPAAPSIAHPLDPASSAQRHALPAVDDSDPYVKNALIKLLGSKNVLSFLVTDGFVRRFVATVNNLATDNAAAELWPVNRTAGSFRTEARAGGGTVISARNADRYAALVRFAEGVDTQEALAVYLRLYPLFQRAHEDLGYPGKYFNDRVVEVIDNLLATPDLAEPIRVKVAAVGDGPTKPPGPGTLYLFEDAAVETSTAGQKALLRVGRENAARLRAKLIEIRHRVATVPGAPTHR